MDRKNALIICTVLICLSLACSLLGSVPQAEQAQAQSSPLANKPIPTITPETPLFDTQGQNSITLTPSRSFCTVVAEILHFRAAPGQSARVLGYLKKGDILQPTSAPPVEAWVNVITEQGLTGWVHSNYIICKIGN